MTPITTTNSSDLCVWEEKCSQTKPNTAPGRPHLICCESLKYKAGCPGNSEANSSRLPPLPNPGQQCPSSEPKANSLGSSKNIGTAGEEEGKRGANQVGEDDKTQKMLPFSGRELQH